MSARLGKMGKIMANVNLSGTLPRGYGLESSSLPTEEKISRCVQYQNYLTRSTHFRCLQHGQSRAAACVAYGTISGALSAAHVMHITLKLTHKLLNKVQISVPIAVI